MFSKLNLYIVALCSFLMTAPVWSQSVQDSTDLPKMQESDFKAVDLGKSLTVLTKGNIKKTFKGMKVTVDNIDAYRAYHDDLLYTVVEHSGNLAIQRYTPKITCRTNMNKEGRDLCFADDKRLAGRSSIMCVIPEGAKSCLDSNGGYYELTLSGLLMGESYANCWLVQMPMYGYQTKCGYSQRQRKVYMWDASVAGK